MTVGFSSETESATGRIVLKWNVKDLEIRTRSIEMSLAPLVIQVTTLVNSKRFSSSKKKGKSKKVHVLVAAVQRATEKFVEHGEQIANENPEIQKEMLNAVEEVRKTGETMVLESREFAEDPTSTQKREKMVLAARNLLSAVTRLLILADMVDVSMLLKYLRVVESDLDNLKTATSQEQVLDRIQAFGRNATELMQAAARRQQELRDHLLRDDLASARALLRKHSTMLLTASKVYVRHPELAAAKANRDFVFHQVCEAVNTISDVAQGRPGVRHIDDRPGELATALDEFDERVAMEPLQSGSVQIKTRQALEEQLEAIIRGAAVMADSSSTRDDRRDRIVTECNALRMALQDLLTECISNAGKGDKSNKVDHAIVHLGNKTSDLRRQLRKTVADHVSDSFLDTGKPLLALIEAAKAGNPEEVEECGKVFAAHAAKLGEVANLVCNMSTNEDGVKMVRYAVAQIQNICPQVVNAARILAAHPNSKVAQENMEVFRKFWETQVRILTDAVDDITSIDDFLAVSENHMLEDLNRCLLALEEEDGVSLNRTCATINGRSNRLVNVVSGEMSIYESGFGYVERVIEAVKVFRDQVIPNFSRSVAVCTEALGMKSLTAYEENEFIDASRLVYDGLREIRRAVLMNRADDELDPEEIYFDDHSVGSSTLQRNGDRHVVEDYADMSGGASEGQALLKMTEEDKKRIAQEVKSFHTDKLNFDREVSKWDDTGNDIIVIAKQMSMIIMQMTDFTRGRGPLKTTMHVISAAQKISEFGTRLDKLAGQIAAQCPESSTKNDLLAYLQRIALHCHQLNITSKVKADVQSISGEVIVSGLDSATSLIQAAKNLMNAVVLTVKASYVASTKYPSQTTQLLPSVVWKMKAPEKKPLVRRDKPDEVRAIVRRGSQKNRQTPMQALSEFQSPAESV